jgi:integrase
MWPSSFDDDFYIAMQKIGISEEQRKERNIVFHSLRHYCATQIAQRASLEIAMKILGHRTEEMTRLYSEHENQLKLNNAKEVLSQGWNVLIAA